MISTGFRQYLPALALMLFSTVWVTALTLRPRPGEPVAALFSPIAGPEAALAAASEAGATEVLRFGRWPSLIIIRSADTDLSRQLRARGAWLVLRAPLAFGCVR